MAVFGIPVAQEDDAVRAAHATAAMRDEIAGLRGKQRHDRGVELAVRITVNTGGAAPGADSATGAFTAGDLVTVAARLEQGGASGDILLVRDIPGWFVTRSTRNRSRG